MTSVSALRFRPRAGVETGEEDGDVGMENMVERDDAMHRL